MMRKNKFVFLFYIGIVLMILLSLINTGQNDTRALDGTLKSVSVTTPPVLDGDGGDAAWANATSITTSNDVTIKSVYTNTTIYFLLSWSDSTGSNAKNQWRFDAGVWSKSGDEDRLAMFWDMGNTVDFDSEGCQILCHLGVGGNSSRNAMGTNNDTEKGDMWHWKAARGNAVGYADDKWMDNAEATDAEWIEDDHDAAEAAHHGDTKDSGGYSDNKQTLAISDSPGNSTTIPMYYEPNATGDDAMFITQQEIDDVEAKQITSVDSNGTLSHVLGTVPADAKIPGYILEKPVGSRGDISANGKHASGTWTLELSRALDTTHDDDVKFTTGSNDSFFFGVAVFDNSGGISHSTSGSNSYKLIFEQPVPAVDTDGDGVNDDVDAFPNDANETADTDSDGVGDNADKFPSDASETKDADGDGVGDNGDKFDDDVAASKDSDGDGYPDEWNTGKSASDSTTNLSIDEFPDDATKWAKDVEDDGDDDDDEDDGNTMMLVIVVIVVVVVVLVLVMVMGKKKKPEEPGDEGSKDD